MRHLKAYSSLGRLSAHRQLMLRNLINSLLVHGQITTTLAKAQQVQRLAEQVVTSAIKGNDRDIVLTMSNLFSKPDVLLPIFAELRKRYQTRPGGYTRMVRSGNRVGDNAPTVVLELVDGPNDLKFEITAKTLGRELAILANGQATDELAKATWWDFRRRVEGGAELDIVNRLATDAALEPLTRANIRKALHFRAEVYDLEYGLRPEAPEADASPESPDASAKTPEAGETSEADEASPDAVISPTTLFLNRAHHHYLQSLASLRLASAPRYKVPKHISELDSLPRLTYEIAGRKPRAGERLEGWQLHKDLADPDESQLRLAGAAPSLPRHATPIGLAKGNSSRAARRNRG